MSYDTLPRLLILECAYRDLSDRIFSECSFFMILFCDRKYQINVSRNKYLHLLCFVQPILSFSHENLSNPSRSSYRFCSAVGKFEFAIVFEWQTAPGRR